MRRDVVMAVARRDIARVVRSRGVRIPLLVFPFIILVLLPTFLVWGQELLARANPGTGLAETPFAGLLVESERIAGAVPAAARWPVFVLEVFMAPLFLLVPLAVSTVIAADSFAGERERGTLEPLLHSPVTDHELLVAKFVAAWLPATAVATVGFALYTVVANGLAWGGLGHVFFPSGTWLALGLWVAPGLAALGLAAMVVISSRVRSLQAAHQLGSLVVIPVLLLLVGQMTGVTRLRLPVVVVVGALVWAGSLLLLRAAMHGFTRDRLTSGPLREG